VGKKMRTARNERSTGYYNITEKREGKV